MATTNEPNRLTTTKVRFAFCNVWEAVDKMGSGKEKYSLMVLIPKTNETTIDRIRAAQEFVANQYKAANGGKLPKNFKLPLRDADEEDDKEDNPDFQGHYFLNVSSVRKPSIVDRNVENIKNEEDFYSGCWGRISLNFFSFDQNGSKGIAVGFSNIQKLSEGNYIGSGASKPEDDFAEPIEDDDDNEFD